MKHQQVSVDFWAMAKSMLTYALLTGAGWVMMRLFNAVYTLPRRMRDTRNNIQAKLEDIQRRYPDLKITDEDLENADKEYEEWIKGLDGEAVGENSPLVDDKTVTSASDEDKKTI